MNASAFYTWLMDGDNTGLSDPLDVHAVASILAVAMAESRAQGMSLSETTGLTTAALRELVSIAFPHAVQLLTDVDDRPDPAIPDDERCLRELLARSTTNRTPFQLHLAALIARRAMRPNHLWQDVGLRNRGELSDLLGRHFAPLARRNVSNMKWKKFFYRMICRDEGFRLCTAPSCAECDDFSVCFGDESGESLLARNRREAELAPASATLVSLG